MAFIRIRIKPELESLRARALTLDDIVSPYLVHRRPDRMQDRWVHPRGKDEKHWTAVDETYSASHSLPLETGCPAMPRCRIGSVRPSTRSGVWAADCTKQGHEPGRDPRTDDPFLRKTTAIYLERGRDGLSDEDFLAVQAPFTLKDLLGG